MFGGKRTIEFNSRESANEARRLLPETAIRGDRRRKTIEVDSSSVDSATMGKVVGMAADSRMAEAQAAGQIGLTDREKQRIDFGETDIFTARSAKGIFAREGVDDWTSFFDPSLTVDEHRSIATEAVFDDQGRRMDHEGVGHEIERMGRAFHTVESEECGHAAEYAAEDQDAAQFLIEDCGWTEGQVQNLREPGPDIRTPVTIGEVDAVDIIRARSHGRFLNEPPEPAPNSPGFRKPSTGRYVGSEFQSPAIGRDPETGQFVNSGEAEILDGFGSRPFG